MWPGPPVMDSGIKPSLFYPFINKFHYHKKVERVAKWLGAYWSSSVVRRVASAELRS